MILLNLVGLNPACVKYSEYEPHALTQYLTYHTYLTIIRQFTLNVTFEQFQP